MIVTFNYDTLLEQVLDQSKRRYRLYPLPYERITPSGFVADDRPEIVLLKMHGSIDWFDITEYEIRASRAQRQKVYQRPSHAIFQEDEEFTPTKIIDEPFYHRSPLQKIYRIKNLDRYFQKSKADPEILVTEAPLLVSPSHTKLAYLNPLRDFWHIFFQVRSMVEQVSVIGFSLPNHDKYLRQPLYSLVNSGAEPRVVMVDCRSTLAAEEEYKTAYSFMEPLEPDYYFGGLNQEAVDLLFAKRSP